MGKSREIGGEDYLVLYRMLAAYLTFVLFGLMFLPIKASISGQCSLK